MPIVPWPALTKKQECAVMMRDKALRLLKESGVWSIVGPVCALRTTHNGCSIQLTSPSIHPAALDPVPLVCHLKIPVSMYFGLVVWDDKKVFAIEWNTAGMFHIRKYVRGLWEWKVG